MIVRIIGDVHGDIEGYVELLVEQEYSVQVGDMGFYGSYMKLEDNVPFLHHVFIPGNHDDYDHLPLHALNDWGTFTIGGFKFFFARGAYSPDVDFRVANAFRTGKSWWKEEQLTLEEGAEALDAYDRASPDIMITHDCPSSMIEEMRSEFPISDTQELLQKMYEVWQPRYWIFGHWHQDKVIKTPTDTTFICLGVLSHADWDTEKDDFA